MSGLFLFYLTLRHFSERELTFKFATCCRSSVCRLSVVCLWRSCALLSRLIFSAMFPCHSWQSVDIHGTTFYEYRPRGSHQVGGGG